MRNPVKLFSVSILLRCFLLIIIGISVSMPLVGCGGSKPAEGTTAAPQEGAAKEAAVIKEAQDEKHPDKK